MFSTKFLNSIRTVNRITFSVTGSSGHDSPKFMSEPQLRRSARRRLDSQDADERIEKLQINSDTISPPKSPKELAEIKKKRVMIEKQQGLCSKMRSKRKTKRTNLLRFRVCRISNEQIDRERESGLIVTFSNSFTLYF